MDREASAEERVLAYVREGAPLVRSGLRKAHVSFRLASDSRALARELQDFAPTLVIADFAMPRMDGVTLRRQARALSKAVVVLIDSSVPGEVGRVMGRLSRETKSQPSAGDQSGSLEDLHDPKTGRLDAERMAAWLGISLTRFAKCLGKSVQTVHKTPSGQKLQEKLAVIARIAMALQSLFATQRRARVWLNSPHRELDGATPLALIESRKAEVVVDLLEDAIMGHPG